MIGGRPVPTTARPGSSIGVRLSATSVSKLRVRVSDRAEIGGPRAGVQLAEQRVIAYLALQPGDAARRIVEIAEHDRVGRTGLLACGLDFAVANAPVLLFRFDPRAVDSLHAVRAFLHHAAAADGDVGIPAKLQARCVPVLIEEEIEAADFVGTVVLTVPRADAAVVDHVVETFMAVNRRGDR